MAEGRRKMEFEEVFEELSSEEEEFEPYEEMARFAKKRGYSDTELGRLEKAREDVELVDRIFGRYRIDTKAASFRKQFRMWSRLRDLSRELGYVVIMDDFSFQKAVELFEGKEPEILDAVLDEISRRARIYKRNGEPELFSVEDVDLVLENCNIEKMFWDP